MKQIRAPEFLNNLYRDMRDRRLLLPALGLVVCLIAIPQLLSSSSSTTPPAPTVPIDTAAKQTAAEPAVVTEELGVTNYRKRLEEFKSKNPFTQHFAMPKVTNEVTQASVSAPVIPTGTTSATTSTRSTSTPSTSTTSTSSTTSSTTTSTTEPTSSTSDTGATSSQSGGHEHHHHHAPKPVSKLIERRIDVKMGRVPYMQKRLNVEQLSFLPYAGKPIVAFLGTSENGNKATFRVSTDVTLSTGDGHCLAKTDTCQYLTLREGDVESFAYSRDTLDPGATYKLKLLRIRDVVVKNAQG